MSTRRTIRVSEIIRKELANLIARTRTLEGQIITISSVETAPDMRNAFIYISVLETEVPREKTMAELLKHRREWQRELGQHLQSKFTPALQFRFDESIERGDRVMEILTDLKLPIGEKLPPPVLTDEEEHEARGDEPDEPRP
ncbi:MAG: ribosome-binding factor A [Verrucomicrobia bacterium Tous-C9LFEB]|nr:MAG: ribosome-binding factor A [Verrucomicrobia bacterium Tous-C9LFEB]